MSARAGRIGAALDARRWLASALAMGCLACGQAEGAKARVASMVATTGEAEAEAEVARDATPVIASVELEPKRPLAGTRVRAKARLAPGPGRKAQVAYRWQTAGGSALGEGRELDTHGIEPGSVILVVATPELDGRAGESFVHRFRLAAPESQLALVVIDVRDGRQVGSLLRAVVETTDESEGFDAVALEWRVAGKRVGEGEELDTTPFAPGDVVELRAYLDGDSERGRPVHAEPIVLERSAPPRIISKPKHGVDGGRFHYVIEAESPAPGAELHFELRQGPEGMTVDRESGLVQWRPGESQRGRFDVEVAVMDQWGGGMAQSFSIAADSGGAPPAAAQ